MNQPFKPNTFNTNVDAAIDTEVNRAQARVDKWRKYAADVTPIASRDIIHAIDDVLEVVDFAKKAKGQNNMDIKNKALVRLKAKNDLLNPADVKNVTTDPTYTGAGDKDQTYWRSEGLKGVAVKPDPATEVNVIDKPSYTPVTSN